VEKGKFEEIIEKMMKNGRKHGDFEFENTENKF